MTEIKKKRGRPRVTKGPEVKPLIDTKDPLKEDFRNFMYVIWQHRGFKSPTKAQYRMGYELQHSYKRFTILSLRGVGKSDLTVAYAAWLLYCNPQTEILVVSAGETRSTLFSTFLRTLIEEVPILKHLRPRQGQRDSVETFDVGPKLSSGTPSVTSRGITGQITGLRADIIIGDDLETPKTSSTHDQREKLLERVREFSAIIKPDSHVGKIMFLGTPQTEQTLYMSLEEMGFQTMIYPARYPNEREMAFYRGRLHRGLMDDLINDPTLVGQPTEPERFPEEVLQEKLLEYGRSGFAMQFMLNPTLSDGNRMPLKIDDLVVMSCKGPQVPTTVQWSNNPLNKISNLHNVALAGQAYYSSESLLNVLYEVPQVTVMFVDPSGRGTDETAVTVLRWSSGNLFLVKVLGLKGGYTDETLQKIADTAKEFNIQKVIIESNWGDGMFTKLLTPFLVKTHKCGIEEVKHHTQKELRIIGTLEPILNQHRLIVDPSVIQEDYEQAMNNHEADKARDYMLFYQMTRITKDRGALKHDDRLDCLAMAVKYFTDKMALDQEQAEARRKEELFDQMLKRRGRSMDYESVNSDELNCVSRWKD